VKFKLSVLIAILICARTFILGTDVCINDTCYQVEVARSQEERQRGLMFRRVLPPKTGMWFVFQREDIYPFWMKNTYIPLDLIWVDSHRRVVFIQKNAVPFSEVPLIPNRKALYVLELLAGSSDRDRITVGDRVRVK
jgi:uncharacterized membrane protein (UPF0127 family)